VKFLKRLAELREANRNAAATNHQILEQADRDHEAALEQRDVVTAQAGQLKKADRRNHYSESLTQSFRGMPA